MIRLVPIAFELFTMRIDGSPLNRCRSMIEISDTKSALVERQMRKASLHISGANRVLTRKKPTNNYEH